MPSPLRVYLDNADICNMSDDTAPHDEELQAAIAEAGAHVMYSHAHVLDIIDMAPDSLERWFYIVDGLGPARWIFCSGEDVSIHPLTTADIPDMVQEIQAWRSAKASIHEAAIASHAALNPKDAAGGPPIGGKQLRTVVAEILDGKHAELLSQYGNGFNLDEVIAALGITREEILARVAESPEKAFVREGVLGGVRARIAANYTRRPLPSDFVDLEHLRVLPHVDIFTADRQTYSHVVEVVRNSGLKTVVLRSSKLDEVTAALRDLAAGRRPRQTAP